MHAEPFHLTLNDQLQSTALSAYLQSPVMVSQRCKTEVVWCRGSTKSHSKHYPVIPGCRTITRYHLLLLFSFWSIDDIMLFLWSTSGAVLTCSFVDLTLCFLSLLLYLHFRQLFLQNRMLVFHHQTPRPTSVCFYRSVSDLQFGLSGSANFSTS